MHFAIRENEHDRSFYDAKKIAIVLQFARDWLLKLSDLNPYRAPEASFVDHKTLIEADLERARLAIKCKQQIELAAVTSIATESFMLALFLPDSSRFMYLLLEILVLPYRLVIALRAHRCLGSSEGRWWMIAIQLIPVFWMVGMVKLYQQLELFRKSHGAFQKIR